MNLFEFKLFFTECNDEEPGWSSGTSLREKSFIHCRQCG